MKHYAMLILAVILGAELSVLIGGEWVVMFGSFAWVCVAAMNPHLLAGRDSEVSHLRVVPVVTKWPIWPRASESR